MQKLVLRGFSNKRKFNVRNRYILKPHPLFSMTIFSGAMNQIKWPKQLQTHNSVVNLFYRQLQKSSKYVKIVVLKILIQHFGDIDAFIRHNFMILVISKCKIKDILMLKLMFGAKFR